jgi:lambda family phage tail tape measure protein
MADSVDVSVQSLLALQRAFIENGGSADAALNAIAKFSQNVGNAADGAASTQKAFDELGISLDDLSKLSTEKLLNKTFAGLEKVKDAATRNALAFEVLGKTVKGVALDKLGAAYSGAFAGAANSAASIQAAGQASQNFSNAINTLQVSLLQALKPISDFFNGINPKAIEGVISTVVRLAQVLGVLFIATKGLRIFADTIQVIRAPASALSQNILSMGGAVATLKGSFTSFGSGAGIISRFFGFFTRDVLAGTLTVGKFTKDLSAMAFGFTRMLPLIGQAIAAFVILDEVMKGMTKQDLKGWWDDAAAGLENYVAKITNKDFVAAINEIGKAMGMRSAETIKAEKDAAAAAKTSTESDKANADAKRNVVDALKAKVSAINDSVSAYKSQGAEALKAYKLDTDLIGKGATYVETMKLRAQVDQQYAGVRKSLEQQLAKSTEKKEQEALKAALAQVSSEYNKQKASIDELVAAREKATQANNFELFSTQALQESLKKINDLYHEAESVFLPEIEKKYKDLEKAAKDSADAAIRAEIARRGEAMSWEEQQKYYEAAKANLEALKKAELELAQAQQQKRLVDFGTQARIDQEKELQGIMDDTAKLTLPEIKRMEYDIVAAAKEKAKAEIEAENARRGTSMSLEEEQAYYDAATKGVKALTQAQRENYEASRSFATGWSQAFNEYVENATNAAQQARNVFQKVTQGMEDLIIDFAKTGKFEFKSFMNSIVEMLLRSEIQQLMAKMFTVNKVGGAGGNIFSAIGSLLGFADGGVIPTNKPVLVGERGPELLTGAAGRTVIPNHELGASTQVTYNINAVDARSFQQLLAANPEFLYAVSLKGQRGMPGGR